MTTRSLRIPGPSALLTCIVAAATTFGCDASTSPAPAVPTEAATGDGNASGGDAGAATDTRSPPVFLDPSEVTPLVVIAPALEMGVVARHEADGAILGSRWGRHGGPMVTTSVYASSGPRPEVVRWSAPSDARAASTKTRLPIATAQALPKTLFYGADGMVDLPFGDLALLSYTGSGAGFPGEALLYAGGYDAVRARANANGFYSGVGLVAGGRSFVVYSGLSALSSSSSPSSDNGLWVAESCGGTLVAPAPCAAPAKLFGWVGASGPVAVDRDGDVFVGASRSGAATSDAVLALASSGVVAARASAPVDLAEVDSGGTSSLAAIAPAGAYRGWAFGVGFAADQAIYGAPFTSTGGVLAKSGAVVTAAIAKGPEASAISVFADADGDLWLAVTTTKTGYFLALRRRP